MMMKLAIVSLVAMMWLCPQSVECQERRYCGRELAEALSHICEGNYFDGSDDDTTKRRRRATTHSLQGIDSVSSWLLSRSRTGMEQHRRRPTRGIVEECCYNQCSPSDLAAYCG